MLNSKLDEVHWFDFVVYVHNDLKRVDGSELIAFMLTIILFVYHFMCCVNRADLSN